MKSTSRAVWILGFLSACLTCMALILRVDAQTVGWLQWPGLTSSASPAVCDFSDGNLYIAAVGKDGVLQYTYSDGPNFWTGWGRFNNSSPFVFATDTSPAFVREGNKLHLFARTPDNNIYFTTKDGMNRWTNWRYLITDGSATGNFSVALTRLSQSGEQHFHLVYNSYNSTVKYAQFTAGGAPTGLGKQWDNALDGTIGTNGSNDAVIAIRSSNTLIVESVRSILIPFTGVYVWGILPVATRTAAGAEGRIYDQSNVVYFAGAFHIGYSIKYLNASGTAGGYVYALEHARYRLGAADDGYRRFVTGWDPNGMPPETELCVYRNKLVAAYKDEQGYVRYARWDDADPATPWVGRDVVAGGRASRRPALAAFNRRANPIYLDDSASNFGNDLFAVVNGYNDDSIWISNFSRDIFRQDIDRQFAVYNSRSDTQPKVCNNDPNSFPLRVSVYSDNRPVLSELGYLLWTTPAWFSDALFYKEAVRVCNSGSRWFKQPCTTARIPVVIMRPENDIFFCDGASIWVTRSDDYKRIYEEVGHITAGAIGINDTYLPTAQDEARSGIPLAELNEAYGIFGVNPTYKNSAGRYVGFTDVNHETVEQPSRQHHFIYVMLNYFSDGDKLRQWVQEDLSVGNDLLNRKYDWIKQNIFRGVEFGLDNELRASRPPCTYSLSPSSQRFTGAGTGAISVLTQDGCNWTAASSANWISIASGKSGTGSGQIHYSVPSYSATAQPTSRTGKITVAGQTVTITQSPTICVNCLPKVP